MLWVIWWVTHVSINQYTNGLSSMDVETKLIWGKICGVWGNNGRMRGMFIIKQLNDMMILIMDGSQITFRVLRGLNEGLNRCGRNNIVDGGFWNFIVVSGCVTMLHETCIKRMVSFAAMSANSLRSKYAAQFGTTTTPKMIYICLSNFHKISSGL